MNELIAKVQEVKATTEEVKKYPIPESEIDRALEMFLIEGRDWN